MRPGPPEGKLVEGRYQVQVVLQLRPGREASRRVRAALRDLRPRLGDRRSEHLLLVVSELVNNAVLHGPGRPIRVRVSVDPSGAVRGEIEDQGSGSIDVPAALNNGSGFGLRLVDKLCDRWGVSPGSTYVWFELAPDG